MNCLATCAGKKKAADKYALQQQVTLSLEDSVITTTTLKVEKMFKYSVLQGILYDGEKITKLSEAKGRVNMRIDSNGI